MVCIGFTAERGRVGVVPSARGHRYVPDRVEQHDAAPVMRLGESAAPDVEQDDGIGCHSPKATRVRELRGRPDRAGARQPAGNLT